VRAVHRYLTNRPVQFNYQDALVTGLSIGSGEITLYTYAKHMLALGVCRANQKWDSYYW
jgi:hypothetical protein